MTKGILIKVYMIPVKPKHFDLLQHTLRSSVDNCQNLIVKVEELKRVVFQLNSEESNRLREFLEEIGTTLPKDVNYVWFYL